METESDKMLLREIRIYQAINDLKNKVDSAKEMLKNETKLTYFYNQKFQVINKLSLSTETILKNYPTGDPEIDESLQNTISIISEIPILNENIDNGLESYNCEIDEKLQCILKKLRVVLINIQNRINNIPCNVNGTTLNDLLNCERGIEESLYYAEDDGLLFNVDEDSGWKKLISDHKEALVNLNMLQN
jgi:hypothetical protein